jgi:hypothetical protein
MIESVLALLGGAVFLLPAAVILGARLIDKFNNDRTNN